ncbi:MAG: oxidoreductase [Glaciihabitans sp.]|nr:oxidoreductase [Glaciihabitans sp.]
MTDRNLRWGIIGPGTIARRFAGELDSSTTGRLVAVGSRSLDRARQFVDDIATASGKPIAAFDSYEELLASDIDAVYISTVHTEHARLVVLAAEAGKHIICEKPLAVNHAGVMVAVEAARQAGVYLAEAYMYRFHPQTARLVELIRDGAIGDVQHVEASFSFTTAQSADHRLRDPQQAGGGILDVGGYPVSMSRLIAGVATGTNFAEPVSLTGSGTIGTTGVDEWATASLVFASGITAHLTSGVGLDSENTVVVYGSAGRITLTDPWMPDPAADATILVSHVDRDDEVIRIRAAHQYALEADALAVNWSIGQSPQMSWADSLGNARVLDQWREAVGLVYPFEQQTANIPPVSGRRLAASKHSTMRYGEIAGVDKRISRLVMGCDNQRTLPHAAAMFDDFFERGGTTFDSAFQYGGGVMERMLGRWIDMRGIRDDVVVIGKGAHTPFCDPISLTRQLIESLDRLGTDHVDVYLMHRDNPDIPVGEFVDVLDEHARAGRIRAFGGSNWSIPRFEAAQDYARANGRQSFAALSNHFGLARALDVPWAGCEQVTDPESRNWLERTNTPLLPWSSQARGFFTGRAKPDDLSDAELVRCYYSDDNFERLARARALGEKRGVAPTAIALAYVLAQSFPTFALIGPRSIEETRTSFEGLGVELTPDEVNWLDLRSP